MEEVLKQIKTVPGTLGSLVYDDQGRVVAHLFPGIFDTNILSAAVTTVSDNLPGLNNLTGGVRMIDFRFQRGRIVVKPVTGGCLVILCEGTLNLQLLLITLNLAVKPVEKILASAGTAPLPAAVEAKNPTASVASPQDLIDKGALAANLQGLQTTLAKFMGPMAQVIFLECVEKWLLVHPPVKAFLPQLVDIVAAEIGDPVKESDYRKRVSTFL